MNVGVLLIALVTSTAASAQEFSYKGVRVGDSVGDLQMRLPDYRRSTSLDSYFYGGECASLSSGSHDAVAECFARVSIGGARVDSGVIRTSVGEVRLIELEIHAGSGDLLEDTLTKAYGQPVSLSRPALQNRMGAKFTGFVGRWESDADVLTYFRDGDKQNTLRITSKAADAKRQEQERERVKAGAKDF